MRKDLGVPRHGPAAGGIVLALLLFPGGLGSAQDPGPRSELRLEAASFDPAVEAPSIPESLRLESAALAENRYWIVQYRDRQRPRDRGELASLGAEVLGYLPHDARVVRLDAAQLPALASLPRIRAVVPFEPAFRISTELLAARPAEDATVDVVLELFEGADAISAMTALRRLGVQLVDWEGPPSLRSLAVAPRDRLVEIASVPDLQWIERAPVATLRRNDTTTWVIQSDQNGVTPIWAAGLLGEDEIVGHIDDPLDVDSCYFDDPGVSIGPSHRKIVAHHGSAGSGDSHGTHTAGTAVGDQEPITGARGANGIAYHARIAHTNVSLVSGSNLESKLEELYNDGARVLTNSWGDDSTTSYNTWSRDIDRYAFGHQDSLPCWSVTNLSTLKNPENAKNCLAIGATEQANREAQHCTGGRGPTSDGRRKPEIYAPGCDIFSAKARSSCATASMSGTSMASPAIAGAAMLVRQYYREGFHPTGTPQAADGFEPSASLIKATLINAAVDMTGVSGYPSDTEGWGRLLLDRGLFLAGDSRNHLLVDVPTAHGFSGPSQMHSYRFDVVDAGQPLEITLAFTDKEGTVNTNFAPVNDLDLVVVDPQGTVYLGNDFFGGESTTGGSADPLNNVERVRRVAPVPGTWVLRVAATNVVSSKNQSYSVVIDGGVAGRVHGTFEQYGNGLAGSGGFVPVLMGEGVPNAGSDLRLEIADGLGAAFTKLLLTTAGRLALPFAGGELLVAPPWISLNFTLDGTAGGAGAGTKTLEGDLPDDPALDGTAIDLQALVFDAGAVQGLALTQGLEIVVGL